MKISDWWACYSFISYTSVWL